MSNDPKDKTSLRAKLKAENKQRTQFCHKKAANPCFESWAIMRLPEAFATLD